MILHLDYETRSLADLPKVGGWRYAFDPSTEILCIGIAEERGDPVVWTPWNHDRKAEALMREMGKPETIIYAHNATGFEVPITDAIFEKTTGFKAPQHHQWRCTAAMGRRAALPSSLKRLAEALKLTNQKDDKGGGLIRKFSIPNGKTGMWVEPEEDMEAFQQFCEYCRQDVRVEQEIHQKLKDFELKGFPLQTFLLDLEINSRGFPVNLEALRKAQVIVEKESARISAQFEQLTGLSPNQNAKFLAWLKERGYERENLQSGTLEEVIEDEDFDPSSEVGKALLLKKRISFASLKKIPAMLACAGPHDNRVRGTLTFHGAGTGRWSASLVQPQNFKRPTIDETEDAYAAIQEGVDPMWLETMYGSSLEVVSSCIRHFIHDVDGGPMLDADYAAIEARALAWQANEKWRLDVFNTHGQIYESSAAAMFKIPLSEFADYKKKTGKQHPLRQKGKVAELACIAEGQLVFTDRGLVPIEQVLPDMLVYDGKEFVKHGGVVYQGIKEVITYGNLTATQDHIVFTEEGEMQLADAAKSGSRLLQPGAGWEGVRLCEDHISREEVQEGMVGPLRRNGVPELFKERMASASKSFERQIQRVPEMLPTSFSSMLVDKSRYSDAATMHESERCGIQELRRERYPVQVSFCVGRSALGDEQPRLDEEVAARPGQQRRSLRAGESSLCHSNATESEQEDIENSRSRHGMGEEVQPLLCFYNGEKTSSGVDAQTGHRGGQESSSREAQELEGFGRKPRQARTYDILNCGPRNRFVVSGVLVHNCGYRGGPGAMERMGALKQGLTKEELPGIVSAWREASPQIVRLWNETEQAAIQAVRNPMKKIPFGVRCHFFTAKTAGMDYLFMVMPSGRRIAYPEPKIEKMLTWKVGKKVRLPDGKEDVEVTWKKMLNPSPEQMAVIRRTAPDAKMKDALTFYGQLPKTVNWGRVVTHGGVLVENLCQGVCADFMAHGAINASRAGYEICALIHDEALAYYHPEKGQSLEEFVALLTKLPEWAEGMPLKAEGDVVKFYKK